VLRWLQESAQHPPAPDAKLDGCVTVVHKLWRKSQLKTVGNTWEIFGWRNECDPDGMGLLDRNVFACGMARIDEDLQRAQVLSRVDSAGQPGNAVSAAWALRLCPILHELS